MTTIALPTGPDVADESSATLRDDAGVWRACGAHDDDIAALRAYAEHAFGALTTTALPLPDEPCVSMWSSYANEARTHGAAEVLRRHLPQLRFAIAAETADDPRFQAAVRRGEWPTADTWPGFDDADGITLGMTETAGGRVPVIVARARGDFERLVQALTKRNAPVPVPPSSGACMVAGYVNWDRVRHARRAWAQARGGDDAAAWSTEFQRLRADPAQWQDRFMLLSAGPYAAVPAADLGLTDEEWRDCSIVLRREHEAAHYVTKRLFGVMHNALHDELLADYAGIVAAAGRYRTDWARRVLGIGEQGTLIEGGRLWNYRGTPPLCDRAMHTLSALAARAIDHIAAFDALRHAHARGTPDLRTTTAALIAIAQTPLEALGDATAPARLHQRYQRALVLFPAPARM